MCEVTGSPRTIVVGVPRLEGRVDDRYLNGSIHEAASRSSRYEDGLYWLQSLGYIKQSSTIPARAS